MIEVRNVTKNYRFWNDRPDSIKTLLVKMAKLKFSFGSRTEFCALSDVSFEIGKGEFVGIMGRNG
ncbi:MAG: ABC transporter ATP-binding protein, partial [Bdellovibrionota bacterium]